MTAPSRSPSPESAVTQDSFVGLFLRLFWMIAGGAILAFLAAGIYQRGPWAFSALDLVYVAVLVGIVVARYLDVRYYRGLTSEGEPSTMAHWRRFSVTICVAALLIWLAARGIALAVHVG